jgi:hypothetical protein
MFAIPLERRRLMNKIFDGVVGFVINGRVPSHYRLQIWEDGGHVAVVGSTPPNHPQKGISLVNSVNEVATQVYAEQLARRKGAKIETFSWYTWLSPGSEDEETFGEIRLCQDSTGRFYDHRWVKTTRRAVERSLGLGLI